MSTIEDLALSYSAIPAASGGRWSVTPLVKDRIFLSRDETGRYAIFIAGELESFGSLPKITAIQHSNHVIPVPGEIPFPALRLTSASLAHGDRIMAHVAYELEQRLAHSPDLGNAHLVNEIAWIFELLSEQESIMSPEEQKGLAGELILLHRLLSLSQELNIPAAEALRRWHGWERAKRDFAARGVAIEVKTTSRTVREHYVGSLDQLDPQGEEEVFVYSIGVRMDPTAPRKLSAFVKDVLNHLILANGMPDLDSRALFIKALADYGYDIDKENLYNAAPGFMYFHLQPKLFREKDLDRLRLVSFKSDHVPSMVTNVMYLLEIKSSELSTSEEREIFVRLLSSPPHSVL